MVKQRKIGDRIFFEYLDGTIGTAIIRGIEDREYQHRESLKKKVQTIKYQMYRTGVYSMIEDYNCLSEDDPRVKEFCKGKEFLNEIFKEKLLSWIREHYSFTENNELAQIFYEMAYELDEN